MQNMEKREFRRHKTDIGLVAIIRWTNAGRSSKMTFGNVQQIKWKHFSEISFSRNILQLLT